MAARGRPSDATTQRRVALLGELASRACQIPGFGDLEFIDLQSIADVLDYAEMGARSLVEDLGLSVTTEQVTKRPLVPLAQFTRSFRLSHGGASKNGQARCGSTISELERTLRLENERREATPAGERSAEDSLLLETLRTLRLALAAQPAVGSENSHVEQSDG